jgi:uncharacterized spore protein YtfJ
MLGRKKKESTTIPAIHTPDGIEAVNAITLHSESESVATIGKLFDVYQPGVVFSAPVTVGDNTVIAASEVNVGMALGFGHGSGTDENDSGEGGGGGGGGASAGRPVAAIIISPKGVQVEPIVDVTKIGLAFFTTIGAMFLMWRAMNRKR